MNKKIVVLMQDLSGNQSFSYKFPDSIGFNPTKVILRQVTYNSAGSEADNVYLLYSDLVSNYLCSFVSPSSQKLDIEFPLSTNRNYDNNSFQYYVREVNGGSYQLSTNAQGKLVIVLEFRND